MTTLKEQIQNLPEEKLRELISDYEQFERDGSIGDCLLRDTANDIIKSFSSSSSLPVVWMEKVAFEAYRELAKRLDKQGLHIQPLSEYDSDGRLIYRRYEGSFEQWSEYDANGNETHRRDSNGFEEWWEYGANGNETHYRNSYGFEQWSEYDVNGNQTHYRDSNGLEQWWEYDVNGNQTHYRDSDGFEEWLDSNGNLTYTTNPYKK